MTTPDLIARGTSASPEPVVRGEPREVSAGVFVISDNRVPLVPNVGIVVGDRAGLVIDTGVGPRNGAYVRDQARRLLGERPLYLVVTQLDPGHSFGAQAFKGMATIILGAAQHDRLHTDAGTYVEAFSRMSAAVAREVEGIDLVEPDIVFDDRVEIDLGSVGAVVNAWGPAHTSDDQTVLVDGRVLFGGDLFQTRMFPIHPYFPPFDRHFDGDRWIGALDELVGLGPDVVVPGHGETTDVEQIVEVRRYLDHIRTETRRLRAAGVDFDVAAVAIERSAVSTWTSWEGPQWISHTVRAFYVNA